jgi:hypothetical protein
MVLKPLNMILLWSSKHPILLFISTYTRMVVTSKLRRHKVMERAMRALMGNNLPPRFKFKDTYDSIEVPTAYQQHLPSQATLEAKFDELIAEEEVVAPTTQIKADMIVSSNLEVGTSNLFVDTQTGRVGIGTDSPAYTLDVHGTSNVGALTATTGTFTGNVGIGTASPTSNLHVFGGALSADTDLATFHYTNPNQSLLKIRQVKHTPANSGWTAWSTRIQQVTDVTNQSYIEFNPVGGTYATAFGRDTSEYMRITGAGNVGIGTASPGYKLHVEDSTNPRIMLENTDTALGENQDIGSILFKQNDTSSTGTGIIGKIRMSSVKAPNRANFYGESANMIFSVGEYADDNANNDALTIRGDGNVGIGTASPGQKLEVGHYGGALSSDFGAIRITNHATNLHATSLARFDISLGDINSNTGSGSRKLIFNSKTTTTDSGTDILCLDGLNNNVGIGTASPGTKLDVVGHPHTFIRKMAQAGTATNDYNHILGGPRPGTTSAGAVHFINGSARTSDGGTDTYTIRNDSGRLRLGNASFDTLLEGKIGIGTASPTHKLHIRSSTAAALLVESNNGGTGYPVNIDFRNYNTQDPPGARISVTDDTDYGSDIRFLTKTGSTGIGPLSERMIIQGDGNVGIGTASPDNKLEVRGNIQASWSDTNHGMIVDAGGTVRRDYGGFGAGFHFTNNAIWPTNYAGTYSAGGMDFGSSSYRWNNVYTEALNATSYTLTGDDTPHKQSIKNSANLSVGWYRIAENGNAVDGASNGSRCSARFTIIDYDSGRHSTRTLYAGGTYGNKPFIHLLTNTSYGSDGSISRVRVVNGSTHEGLAVEIYVDTACNANEIRIVMDDNYQGSGFTMVNFESVVADHSNMNEYVLDLNITFWGMFLDNTTKNICMFENGNVGIGTNYPTAKLHVNGSIYAPGHPVQYVADNVHSIVSYGATSGGRYVTPLDVTITPKFSNSKIFLQWVINCEAYENLVFRVYRGSTLIGYNTSIGNNRWNGVSAPNYDHDQNSTPEQNIISWIDSPNTTSAVTYRVYAQSSTTGSHPFYLNRTYGSNDTGTNAYERMVSYKSAMEIAV